MLYTANLTKNPMNVTTTKVNPSSVTQNRGFIDYKDIKQQHNRSRLHKQQNQRQSNNEILKSLSVNYLKLIQKIDPEFKTEEVFIPKRTLTNPREPSKNNGFDNINDDYILKVNDVLGEIATYEILDLMGQGTFGQVVKCRKQSTGELVAVKVIKRQPAFLMQGDKEIHILKMLSDRREKHRFLQLIDCFPFRGHTCVVFELLSISLYGLFSRQIKKPHLSIEDIQKISFNVLETLALLKEMRIIHTDLKPDNILLKSFDDIHNVKLIDYGSALLETEQLNYCVQTAFYRSPEVILHVEFGCAIDMWSFGCFVAEMFLGRPLFPSGNEVTLLHMMVSTLGYLPPDSMLKKGKNSNKFFHLKSNNTPKTKLRDLGRNTHDNSIGKSTLRDKIMGFSSNDDSDDESIIDNYSEMEKKEQLYDFLKGILVFEPSVRSTPEQALRHPFIASAMGSTLLKKPSLTNGDNNSVNIMPLQSTNSSSPLSPAMIYETLANTVSNNNSSSLNTSRTTEDSLEIKTPPTLSNFYNRSSKENLLLTPSKSPKIIITSPESTASPQTTKKPLKSILKKTNVDNTILKKTNPDNTLDSSVAYLFHQPRPASALSNTSSNNNSYDIQQQYIHLYNTAAIPTAPNPQQLYTNMTQAPNQQQFSAIASPILQSYQQQQQQQIVNNMFQHLNQNQQQAYINAPMSPLLYQQQQQQNYHTTYQQQNQQPAYQNNVHYGSL